MSSDAHGAPVLASSGLKQPYHLPDPSPWPIIGALGGFLTVFGIVLAAHFGNYVVLVLRRADRADDDVLLVARRHARSSTPGAHSAIVRLSLRYGMTLFIASEVMFFVGFFWSYFNFLIFPGDPGQRADGVAAVERSYIRSVPPAVPEHHDPAAVGTTVTWAHHCLLEGDRKGLVRGLGLTILLGLSFTLCQAIEYSHAPFTFSGGGVYSSVFFLATGFHGFHVIVGTCFLIVCWFRARGGQFTPERHFGFEAAAWYWHFVDVVWLFLFVCIYWYGAGQIAAE